jgi:anti-anti-sigma factor
VNSWIALVDPVRRVLRGTAGFGPGMSFVAHEYSLDDDNVMAVNAIKTRRPIVFADMLAQADAEGWGEVARVADLRMVVYAPLRASGQVLGVFGVGVAAMEVPETESSLLATFGDQLASALWRIRTDRDREQQVVRLQQAYEQQAKLTEVVRELSTPVIPVHDGVLVLPLVGTIDSTRSAQIMDSLLSAVQRQNASVVIVDVTGVPMVDSGVANHLLQAVSAASLLGARCVLVGISPVVAQTMVQLGIDLRGVVTCGNLQAGIAHALRTLKLQIRPVRAS